MRCVFFRTKKVGGSHQLRAGNKERGSTTGASRGLAAKRGGAAGTHGKNKLSESAEYIIIRESRRDDEHHTFLFPFFCTRLFLCFFLSFLFLVMEPPPPSLMCDVLLPFFSSLLFSIFSRVFSFFSPMILFLSPPLSFFVLRHQIKKTRYYVMGY